MPAAEAKMRQKTPAMSAPQTAYPDGKAGLDPLNVGEVGVRDAGNAASKQPVELLQVWVAVAR